MEKKKESRNVSFWTSRTLVERNTLSLARVGRAGQQPSSGGGLSFRHAARRRPIGPCNRCRCLNHFLAAAAWMPPLSAVALPPDSGATLSRVIHELEIVRLSRSILPRCVSEANSGQPPALTLRFNDRLTNRPGDRSPPIEKA